MAQVKCPRCKRYYSPSYMTSRGVCQDCIDAPPTNGTRISRRESLDRFNFSAKKFKSRPIEDDE